VPPSLPGGAGCTTVQQYAACDFYWNSSNIVNIGLIFGLF
jgi:hypothetical protein